MYLDKIADKIYKHTASMQANKKKISEFRSRKKYPRN